MAGQAMPRVGIGYRYEIHDWIVSNLDRFDVLEITIDHFLNGGAARRAAIIQLARRIPLVAHGVGLSVGTAVVPDSAYLKSVAAALAALGIESYSEHLAFTRTPGHDLANLLPLPRNADTARIVVENLCVVREHIVVPIDLENISYYFAYPDSTMSEVEFLNLICRESGTGVLLDVENLRLNALNHGFDPNDFIDALPQGAVRGIHVAGGETFEGLPVDTHSQAVPAETVRLLDTVIRTQQPENIIIERDQRLRAFDEILSDVSVIRGRLAVVKGKEQYEPAGTA